MKPQDVFNGIVKTLREHDRIFRYVNIVHKELS